MLLGGGLGLEGAGPERVDAQNPTPDGRFLDLVLYFASRDDLERFTVAASQVPGFHVGS